MIKILIPDDISKLEKLETGDFVLLSGEVYTARDQVHKNLVNKINNNEKIPVNLKNKIIFYAGPAPIKKNAKSAAIGPTTSYRMDKYTPDMLECGVKGFIGKGKRSKRIVKLIKKYKAVYFITVGGIAAYLSTKIEKMEAIAYKNLGPEAIYRIKVKDFPCIVAIDSDGNDIFNR
ncbi:MAG: TRZ/ATZ family protein [Candidatus Mcinerneyibacterium aminivorans]|uniref:TRZ/ATZ family protein n=1 Tax=Candidatus Mcinerneyibacterium aminivorans TaxID=2703815 RepID=A0A5D0MGJ0_9BACT|nr:MAG: TRZ/ATZ family protein [Candidatus Mcinerneyibacterium aminivorans]